MIDGLMNIADAGLNEAPLFRDVVELMRERLSLSPLGGLLPGEKVVDLFCGAGGWGEGAKDLGIEVDYAVNHWDRAIEIHARNNPLCRHHLGDAWKAVPREVVGARTKIGLLLASAACTTHSKARGSAQVSKRVHMLGWCIARWMREVSPRLVLIENVPEWQDWGPLVDKRDERGRLVRDAQGRIVRVHCARRKGQHFRRWWRQCERLGYVMEMRVLDAPDYGCPSRRRRLFIIARNDGMPIVWPEKTHGVVSKPGSCVVHEGSSQIVGRVRNGRADVGNAGQSTEVDPTISDRRGHGEAEPHFAGSGATHLLPSDVRPGDPPHGRRPSYQQQSSNGRWSSALPLFPGVLIPYRTAAECIDWSDLGRSIFDRKTPLKPKSLARIGKGIGRFVIKDPAPFVLRVTHGEGGWSVPVYPIDGQMPTQTTRQDLAVCTPVVAPQNTGVFGQRPDRSGPAITTKGHQSLIAPVLATTGYGERAGQAARVNPVDGLLGTCVDGVKQAVVSPVLCPVGGPKRSPARPDETLQTVLTREDRGIATPVLMHNTTGHAGGRCDATLPTVTTGGQTGLVSPLLAEYHGSNEVLRRVDEAMGCVSTVQGHGSVSVVMLTEPQMERGRKCAAFLVEHLGDASRGGAVPIDPENGLAYIVLDGQRWYFIDVLFRMLRVPELARAMTFPDSYQWPRTQRDAVRLIGNAVAPVQARALIGAALPGMRTRKRREVAA